MSMKSKKPYGFDEDKVYMLQTLERTGWVCRGRGKLDLIKALKWKKKADKYGHNSIRLSVRFPNGVWFGAWCASQPYVALVLIIEYFREEASHLHRSDVDWSRDRCECGHIRKNHSSMTTATYSRHIGRRWLSCRLCDCARFNLAVRFVPAQTDG